MATFDEFEARVRARFQHPTNRQPYEMVWQALLLRCRPDIALQAMGKPFGVVREFAQKTWVAGLQ